MGTRKDLIQKFTRTGLLLIEDLNSEAESR
jgi:hypothetical protein